VCALISTRRQPKRGRGNQEEKRDIKDLHIGAIFEIRITLNNQFLEPHVCSISLRTILEMSIDGIEMRLIISMILSALNGLRVGFVAETVWTNAKLTIKMHINNPTLIAPFVLPTNL
jgi:hypothetical protein